MKTKFQTSKLLGIVGLLSTALVGSALPANDDLTSEQSRFFESKIRPVLVRECYSCHSNEVGQVRGGLWLDTAEGLRSGGDSGPGVVPGKLDESLLWNAINHVDFVMPPRRKLSDEVLADFKTWIEMGAPDPRKTRQAEVRPSLTDEDIAKGREFWSFKAPVRPTVPQVGSDWAKSDIDRFVWDKLAAHALTPSSDVDAETMLRRLTFDIVGLPPTIEQIKQFAKAWKSNPDKAIDEVVDQLLELPQFGERWGRHWMDLARYAESTGREVNLTFPHAWRYRDYVIDSFNKDKPYNRFVQEQIAGDLLPAPTDKQWAENLVATGFLTLGPKALNEQNGRQFELDLIDEQIDVTTRVMLGVSVACARCHDHKFDPIPQTDYYALSGIFRGMSTHYGTFRTQQNRRPSNLIVMPVEDKVHFEPEITRKQLDELKAELAEKRKELQEALSARRDRKSDDPKNNTQSRIAQIGQLSTAAGLLQAKIDSYDSKGKPLSLCMAVQETTPVNARLLERGEFSKPAQEVERGFPKVLCSKPVSIPKKSTGRLEFAKWVGSSDNPLTARVMVNRVWQHMTGNPIVRTPEDFGSTGQKPTHPELLDFLAVDFMENNWSIKKLVRKIALSHTYRMSSDFNKQSFEADPENRYLWRMEQKRLEAEAIRDSMLAISGELDLKRPNGSVIAQAGTAVVREGNVLAFKVGGNSENTIVNASRGRDPLLGSMLSSGVLKATADSVEKPVNYRSVYLPIVRDNIPRSLDVFDFAEATMVIGVRETSNTPDQGLYFLNNDFVIDRAEAMAKRLIRHSGNLNDQIAEAFMLAYGRPATANEMRAAGDFYKSFSTSESDRSSGPSRRPGPGFFGGRGGSKDPHIEKLTAVCQSIMASAEFRYVN
ncbi:MAG: PSD1 and planctomycete cytochrome C domain-containing protein [Pirellulales bacterium]